MQSSQNPALKINKFLCHVRKPIGRFKLLINKQEILKGF